MTNQETIFQLKCKLQSVEYDLSRRTEQWHINILNAEKLYIEAQIEARERHPGAFE